MQINKSQVISSLLVAATLILHFSSSQTEARSIKSSDNNSNYDQEAASAVIPSPNQLFGDEQDIQRKPTQAQVMLEEASTTSNRLASPQNVPVYVSHYIVPERFASEQESSHSPVNFATLSASLAEEERSTGDDGGRFTQTQAQRRSGGSSSKDLKVAASYGHGHHGHHSSGHDHHGSGWLDMGAYTGKKGSFGWHAKYPVGGKKSHYAK